MDEAQIQDIEQKLLQQYVTAPISLEDEIKALSKEVSGKLLLSVTGTAEFQFLGDPFIARAKRTIQGNKQVIYMVISNEETRRIAGSHYVPFTVTAEVDNSFTLNENYEAIVQAFLRHVSNTEKAEVIEEGE